MQRRPYPLLPKPGDNSGGEYMSDTIAPLPSMDPDGLECFKTIINQSKCYLEYGTGGSTVYAADVAGVPVIISVESDSDWVGKVRRSIANPDIQSYVNYCDIGDVGDWGVPTGRDHIDRFWTYAVNPWNTANNLGFRPDTILVDGRFRVVSFIFSLVSAEPGATLMFDDYYDRPEYAVVEELCKPIERHGRMAVFKAAKPPSMPRAMELAMQNSINWG